MRALLFVFVAACGASRPAATPAKGDASACPAVARHVMAIGPVDRWIAEAREDSMLPVDGASDREGLQKFFELACRESWEAAHRICIGAQPSWPDVERECSNDKVWWYQPT
jgi:hypothetical protein